MTARPMSGDCTGCPQRDSGTAQWLRRIGTAGGGPTGERTVGMERPGSKATLVHFRCTNPAHLRPATERSDQLTLHEGLWAYCEGHGQGPHDWSRVQPTPRETLAAMTRKQERRAS